MYFLLWLGQMITCMFHRKKSNARRFFNYLPRAREREGQKRLPCAENVFKRNTNFYVLLLFSGIESTIHIHTHEYNTIFHSELKHTRFCPNKIGNENKLFAIPLFPTSMFDFILIQRMHKHVYFVPYCVVSNWKSEEEEVGGVGKRETSSSIEKKECKNNNINKMKRKKNLKCIRIHAE